jgi:hypothetical protein
MTQYVETTTLELIISNTQSLITEQYNGWNAVYDLYYVIFK